MTFSKKPAAKAQRRRAGGPEATRTPSFLPLVEQPQQGWRAKPQLLCRSLAAGRLSTRKAGPCPQHQEDTSIRLTMLRQESKLNPSVFRSLSEEEGGG